MTDSVLVATFATLGEAQAAVRDLVQADYDRNRIGLAVREEDPVVTIREAGEDEALVSVTVTEDERSLAYDILTNREPARIEDRDVQWRMKGWKVVTIDPDQFTAPDRS